MCDLSWKIVGFGRVPVPAKTQTGTWTQAAGTRTWSKPWLGLEPMQPGLEPGHNPAWDLNPRGRDSNLATTQLGTWTHTSGTWTQPKPTVFQLRSHTWFQDLMKLRFLMCHHRKNSVKDKVTGKKWIYLERNTLHRVWTISEGKSGLGRNTLDRKSVGHLWR